VDDARQQDDTKRMIEQIREMRVQMKALAAELQSKEETYKELLDTYTRLPKNVNRAVYTNRILDIVKQVKKQKVDINKVRAASLESAKID